uniref:ABC transporter substrate-binding protein n=1 Tax=Pseudonocardia pini TaxID=2758030 RepID=UPI0015EFEE05
LDRDATLRVTWVIPAMPLDPHKAASETGQFPYISPVYDRLTQMVHASAGAELAPMVAESWEFDPASRSVTFHLRGDATFSDGSAVDAAAVEASLERARTVEGSTAKGQLAMIDTIEAKDPRTLVVTTTRPAADLPYVLSTGYGSIINPKALTKPDLDRAPEGSGPYVATQVNLNDGVVYERREGYWDPEAAKVKRLEIKGIPDPNARINGLRGDQSDFTLLQPQQFDVATRLGDDYPVTVYAKSGQMQPVRLNTNRPHLSDVRVRQAMNFAIDRDAISKALLDGQTPAADQPLSDLYAGHLTSPPMPYTYDQQKARDLLAQAGLAGGFTMSMLVPSYSPVTEMSQAVQAQLAQVGITVNLVPMDPIQALQQWKPDTEYDSFMQVRVGYETAATTLSRNYLVPSAFPGPVPAEFSAAVAQAFDPALSEEQRDQVLQSASTIANEQAFDLYLNKVPSLIQTSKRVVGVDSMGRADYQGIFDLRYVGLTKES